MTASTPHTALIQTFIAGGLLLLNGASAHAAGFYLIDQSVSNMGTAYAGGAAMAEDASTLYFNPAGITRFEQPQALFAVNAVLEPTLKFRDNGSNHVLLGNGGLGSDQGANAGVSAEIPYIYYSQPLSSQLYWGIGVNAPFGLAAKYNPNWVGRYYAIDSELKTLNINPSIAYRRDKMSYGVGVNLQYMEARLSNAIDIGTINALPVAAGGFGGAFSALGLVPAASDGYISLQGNDWSWGYNFGVLYEFNKQHRVGFHYRSSIAHALSGRADFTIPGNGVIEAGTGLFGDSAVSSAVKMPRIASISTYHTLNTQWAMMADITWTQWSSIKEVRFQFDSAQPEAVTTYNWRNARRYAIGTSFKASAKLSCRAGIAFDETPVPDSQYRNPRLPDESRTWLTVGLGYQPSRQWGIDVSYAYLSADDAQINKTATGEDALLGGLQGSYKTGGNTLSLQIKRVL